MPVPALAEGALLVLVGAAGSGKSHYAQAFPVSAVVCLDELRERVADDAGDQGATADAVAVQNLLLDARLARGKTTLVDSTNVEKRVRAGLVARARTHGRRVEAVLLQAELEVCLGRNAARPAGRRVPETVLRRQHAQARALTPAALRAEGFDAVHIPALARVP